MNVEICSKGSTANESLIDVCIYLISLSAARVFMVLIILRAG